jgi:fatty acid-binding protein DegV
LPPSFIHEHHIFQIPINIMIDGVSYEDKVTVDSDFLNDHLDTASSAQLNTEQAKQFLTPILAQYEKVLILTVSSLMSGTFSRFKKRWTNWTPREKEDALIETKVNSGAEGLLVKEAVHRIEAGTPFQTIVIGDRNLARHGLAFWSAFRIWGDWSVYGRISDKVGDI